MRSLIDIVRRKPSGAVRRGRPPRPSVLLRRRRQILTGAAVVGLALGLVAGTIWVRQAGFVSRLAAAVTAAAEDAIRTAGLTVSEVYVVGRERSARPEILDALNVSRGDSMLAFDAAAARERLVALGWVRDARIYRRLPDILEVQLEERVPFALWQEKGRLALIDRDGVTILTQGLERFADLPLVVGPDAAENAAELIDMLRLEPVLFAEVDAAVRVGGRRWNVKLKNGVMVNLPERGTGESWARLAELTARHGLMQRDIEAIDLRLPDRLVVRLSPAAAAKRREPGKET